MATITGLSNILNTLNQHFGFIGTDSLAAMTEENQLQLLREMRNHPAFGAYTNELMAQMGYQDDATSNEPPFTPPYSWTNMTLKQKWLLQQLETTPNKLLGTKVKLVCRLNGMPILRGAWFGNIRRIVGNDSSDMRNIDVMVQLDDGTEYLAKVYQIEPFKNVKPKAPTKKEVAAKEKIEKEKFLKSLSVDYCNRSNTNIQSWKREMARYKNDIVSFTDNIKLNERRIKDLEVKLDKAEEKTISPEEYLKLFHDLRQHDKVELFYITQNKNLIVFTKMLYATDRKTNKENETMPLGRFIFKFPLANVTGYVKGYNLDFVCMSGSLPKFHPNIDGDKICWGNNSNDIQQLMRDGNIFLLVDFTISFFSTFPHEEGANPYIDFERWYQTRRLITVNDPDCHRFFLSIIERPYISDKLPFDPLSPPMGLVGRDLVNKIDPAIVAEPEDHDWEDDWDDDSEVAAA